MHMHVYTSTHLLPGLVLIPGTTQLTAKDIELRLKVSQVRALITSPDMVEKVDQVTNFINVCACV